MYNKLVRENKELQFKHEKVCAVLNTVSVALTSSKKDLKERQNEFDKRVNQFEKELLKLSEFKSEQEADDKIRKRAEKKARQKKRKEHLYIDESLDTVILKDFNETIP